MLRLASGSNGVLLAELEVPARAEYVSLVRLVVSSVAGDRYALTDEQLQNLKLAVSEACVLAIQDGGSNDHVRIRCDGAVDRLDVSIRGDGPSAGHELADGAGSDLDTLDELERGLGVPLISSLVDEVTVSVADDGESCLCLTLRCEQVERSLLSP